MPRGVYKHQKHSKEWKTKQSQSMIGDKNPFYGRRHTKETIEKIRKDSLENPRRYWLGKKRPEMSGNKHPMWRGGLRKKKDERNDSLYKWWVYEVKKRDKRTCLFKGQNCSGYTVAHHILPWREYPELRYEIKNGITLCQFHHPRKRIEEQRLIPVFQNLVISKELI